VEVCVERPFSRERLIQRKRRNTNSRERPGTSNESPKKKLSLVTGKLRGRANSGKEN
jgi:hypothetical protein